MSAIRDAFDIYLWIVSMALSFFAGRSWQRICQYLCRVRGHVYVSGDPERVGGGVKIETKRCKRCDMGSINITVPTEEKP